MPPRRQDSESRNLPVDRRRGSVGVVTRFLAGLIDGLLVAALIFYLVPWLAEAYFAADLREHLFVVGALGTFVSWSYYAGLSSSPLQGTLGKRLLGVIITTEWQERISLTRATVHYWPGARCG